MPHLLLVGDDPKIRELNRDYFESRGFCVASCENEEQAFAHTDQYPVDCVILDIMMPGENSFELCRRFKAGMTAPVIFLTSFTEKEYSYQGFSFGGGDFLTKPCDLRELEIRVNTCISQKSAGEVLGEQHKFCPIVLDAHTRQAFFNNVPVALTAYEFDIMLLLVRSPGHVFSPQAIYREVWKLPDLNSAQTVKVHVARMRHKLKSACPGQTFIQTVWRQGYRFISPVGQGTADKRKEESN